MAVTDSRYLEPGQLDGIAMAFGSRIRPSPFFEATVRWGARAFSVYNHMYMPAVYESAVADYEYLTTGVTLWDVGGERQVVIRGADAGRFAQYLTPRDLSGVTPGMCRYVLLTNADGGVINDPVLLHPSAGEYWLSLASTDALLWCWGVALGAGMAVEITTPDISPLQLQGPRAEATAAKLFGDWVGELRYFRCRRFDWEGIPLVISRTGWSGERGFEIYLMDGGRGDELWERIMRGGAEFGIKPATPSPIRRIEGGLLSCGADSTFADTPFHLGLERLMNLDGDFEFIGRERLRAIRAEGVSRRLVGVWIGGDAMRAPVVRWWDVFERVGGRRVGKVRSGVFSHRLGGNIGFAMLDKPFDAAGARAVAVSEYGETRDLTVADSLVFLKSKAK